MKIKLLISLVSLFALIGSINAQTLFFENFDYPAGDSIGSHGWVAHSGSANNVKVVSPGLTFTGYPLSGIGNAARLSNNGIDQYKPFSGDSVTSGSVYVSAMVKIDSIKATGDYFLDLMPPSSVTSLNCRVFAKDTLGGICFGISKSSIGAIQPTWGATVFPYSGTYLVVAKYKFNTGTTTDDEVSLYVFSSTLPATEPSTPYAGPVTTTQTDVASLGRVQLRQGSASLAPTLVIDGVKVGKSWTNIITNVQPVSAIAADFALEQNYPNPFNPTTSIKFSVPTSGMVSLKVYDMLGKEVQTLVNGNLTTGVYTATFDGASLTSGTYIYRLNFINTNGVATSDIKKMTLIK